MTGNSTAEAQALAALVAVLPVTKVVAVASSDAPSAALLAAFTAAIVDSAAVNIEDVVLLSSADVYIPFSVAERLKPFLAPRSDSYVFVLLTDRPSSAAILATARDIGLATSRQHFWITGCAASAAAFQLSNSSDFRGLLGVRSAISEFEPDGPDIRLVAADFVRYWDGLVSSQWTGVTINKTASQPYPPLNDSYTDTLYTQFLDGYAPGSRPWVVPLSITALVSQYSRRQDILQSDAALFALTQRWGVVLPSALAAIDAVLTVAYGVANGSSSAAGLDASIATLRFNGATGYVGFGGGERTGMHLDFVNLQSNNGDQLGTVMRRVGVWDVSAASIRSYLEGAVQWPVDGAPFQDSSDASTSTSSAQASFSQTQSVASSTFTLATSTTTPFFSTNTNRSQRPTSTTGGPHGLAASSVCSTCEASFSGPIIAAVFFFVLVIVALLRFGRRRIDLKLFEQTAIAERSAQVALHEAEVKSSFLANMSHGACVVTGSPRRSLPRRDQDAVARHSVHQPHSA